MKKKSSLKKFPLKSRWPQTKAQLKEQNLTLANPMVKASYTWSIISEQLMVILGPEIHHQWFKLARPTVISDNVLIIEVPNHFCAQWIHTYYHEVIDGLCSIQDRNLSSFFVSQSEKLVQGKNFGTKAI